MIVLDTNVVSELVAKVPVLAVRRWHKSVASDDLYTTTVTQAEMLFGVAILPDGRRKELLQDALTRIFAEVYAGRILPFDNAAAVHFADLAATRKRLGRPIERSDAQIAAIARSRGAAIATRNTGDFEHCGINIINPWTA